MKSLKQEPFADRIKQTIVIRSKRKTIGFRVTDEGNLEIRAPLFLSGKAINECIRQNTDRIERAFRRAEEQKALYESLPPFSAEELKRMERDAKKRIPERVAYFAGLMDVSYEKITIRSQTQRWGSCTSKGNLNFNKLLVLCTPEALDSVVVHELCHRIEMNHSKRFYDLLYRYFPAYDDADRYLKTEGEVLLTRMRKTKEQTSQNS